MLRYHPNLNHLVTNLWIGACFIHRTGVYSIISHYANVCVFLIQAELPQSLRCTTTTTTTFCTRFRGKKR